MTKRIFSAICIMIMTLFLSFFALTMLIFYSYTFSRYTNELDSYTDNLVLYYENTGKDGLYNLPGKEYRISLIDNEGQVLYDTADTNLSKADNHSDREEIKEAFEYGIGKSKRYSKTLAQVSIYNARKLSDGNVIRVSITHDSIISIILGFLRILLAFTVLILIFAMLAAFRLSKMIADPLNKIDIDNPLENEGFEELSSLFLRLESNKNKINVQKAELESKQKELSIIINSISEGMIILNKKLEIININEGAMRFLNIKENPIGRKLININRNKQLYDSIVSSSKGEIKEEFLTYNDELYKLKTYPLVYPSSDMDIQAVVALIFKATNKEEAEIMRREFTANVSHELKTPLQLIFGYAELLKNGMVEKENIEVFAGKIHSEVSRMKLLIDDIIKLSKLDEESKEFEKEEFDLYNLVINVIKTLEDKANEFGISINISGEETKIYAVYELCTLIVYNIVDNAIKYNKQDGYIYIKLEKDISGGVLLSIKDTGIGIDKSEQERIFERFYRVDKSRSKQSGGTGLGLSIVKNAIKVQGGNIELISEPGNGTEVIVRIS